MRVGINLPQLGRATTAALLIQAAERAEALGYLPFGITLNLGLATFTTPTPVITQISSASCVTDPNPANNVASIPNPGWLLMNVTIQFVTLPK
jgi:hypothetical protein